MKLIKVHTKTGNNPIYINIKHIQSFAKAFDCEEETVLDMDTDDGYYCLSETPEEIIELIKEAESVEGLGNV